MKSVSTIGVNIKRIRKSKNISAYNLAKSACVGHTTISEIESGRRQSISSSTLQKIAEALSVSAEQLMLSEANTIDKKGVDIYDLVDSTDSDILINGTALTSHEKLQLKELLIAFKNISSIQRENASK